MVEYKTIKEFEGSWNAVIKTNRKRKLRNSETTN